MVTKVQPALQRQLEELKKHRAAASSDAGVWHFKDGDAYYQWALKAGTTTTRSPDEIHQLGLEQVRAIQSRMESIMARQGMTGGTVGERMAALGKDPAQLYPNTAAGREQLLAYLNGRIADIRTRLPRAFATLVPGRLVIKRVPPSIEAGAPGGYASAGSIDGKVPGQYYINLRNTAEWPKFSLPTLCYHEGIPGHIWQGEYANRMALIRSMLAFNAYSEGWALYSEQLADELGVYEGDPMGQLGYLQSAPSAPAGWWSTPGFMPSTGPATRRSTGSFRPTATIAVRSPGKSTAIAPCRGRPAAIRSATSRSCDCATRHRPRWARATTCARSTMRW
jgi:uncharacterized protein (DUF885 family)